MFFPINTSEEQQGSALVIAVIVLALLTALGFAALNVADLNISIASNDRDAKETFFHADAGTNVGHILLERDISDADSRFYSSEAQEWEKINHSEESLNASNIRFRSFYNNGDEKTLIWLGEIEEYLLPGEEGKTASVYRIRSRRTGVRHSQAVVDLGWKYVVDFTESR
ncbi:MAG: hypothetical protein GX043_05075 [Desulfovibrionales bacterium]|nr:hypothetical protein [Desulfovibrionales bacterium]